MMAHVWFSSYLRATCYTHLILAGYVQSHSHEIKGEPAACREAQVGVLVTLHRR